MSDLSKELMAASSIPIILSTLMDGESYGYEIIKRSRKCPAVKYYIPMVHCIRCFENWKIGNSFNQNGKLQKMKNADDIIPLPKRNEPVKEEKQSWEFMNELLSNLWKPFPQI
ncbi:hypothetical protein KUH03_40370 [Sphingobacterium sp. E70]|nr:hypothetical protein [Sphingobacterium sp. E70]ULT25050.1 hypothetical protein KUH03_40370 [Sphingobacterium sp. E70]